MLTKYNPLAPGCTSFLPVDIGKTLRRWKRRSVKQKNKKKDEELYEEKAAAVYFICKQGQGGPKTLGNQPKLELLGPLCTRVSEEVLKFRN